MCLCIVVCFALIVFAIDGGVFLTVVFWLCLLLMVVYFWRLCLGCVCYWLWCIVDCFVLAVFAIECGVLLTVVSWLCLLLSVVCLPPRASLFAFLHVIWWLIVDRFYIALFSALQQTHCARMWFYTSEYPFTARFWISTRVVYLERWHGWCHRKLLPSRRVLCTPYNHAPCHFMQSHIRKVYACLAVTCHRLRFWQNDRGLLRATAVTRGWNGYRNKSLHRKLTLEKKVFTPLLQV